MHRLAAIPGDDPQEDITLVEQPDAPVLFLTSTATDIACLSSTLNLAEHALWKDRIRALPLGALEHPAQIDHYISTSAKNTKIILIRLLGSKGHWSYGLEQFQLWQNRDPDRNLIVISGTKEHETELQSVGNLSLKNNAIISKLLKVGGVRNMTSVLNILELLIEKKEINYENYEVDDIEDPSLWDWKDENGIRIGVILYRALLQANDKLLAHEINQQLRKKGLVPRTLWVSSLRDKNVKNRVIEIFKKEKVRAILTSTSFSTVEFNQASLGSPLWDQLNVPVFQILTSSITQEKWSESLRGLSPLDLSMQIVLPEIDGRITTRPCAFKTLKESNKNLATAIHFLKPDSKSIKWVVSHISSWIRLQNTPNKEKRICLILANYPVKNSRLANGVGLDTPASTVQIIKWLDETGHYLGEENYPQNSNDLIRQLIKGRTNDPESNTKAPLDYLKLEEYISWWDKLPKISRENIRKRWGNPSQAIDLEPEGFAITGIKYGNIVILIQPSRGYDPDSINDLHSPDLPPPHRYLAQYLWIKQQHHSNVVVHVGKHGSLEWLPGKGVGISNSCYPHIAISDLPNVYPFIVNDPGEGSQAKRRSQAVIIDHLTPPLGKSGLHGDLLKLEGMLDEYYECQLLSNERKSIIESKIINILNDNNWPGINEKIHKSLVNQQSNELLFNQVESYLCEIKECQIRTGLHIFGTKQDGSRLTELLFQIAKCPSSDRKGLTQWISKILKLEIDPWTDDAADHLSNKDAIILNRYTKVRHRIKGDAIDFLDKQALILVRCITAESARCDDYYRNFSQLIPPLADFIKNENDPLFDYIKNDLWIRLLTSSKQEKVNFLKAISGQRVSSGPSGSPTRGRPEILPTGRNFYSIDLRGLPTEIAWELGKKSAQNILELHLLENGEHLKKLALSVWGTATMRNGGEEICQILALMGVQPVWDGPTRRVVDMEIIPIELLGRPRVDILLRISGLFRDAFPQLINYINKATEIVSLLDEPEDMNPIAKATKERGHHGRVYGSAPGSYGAGLQALIDSGSWESRTDLANAYVAWSQWRYQSSDDVIKDEIGLKSSLRDVEVVLHNQDNREHDILDSDDYYQFHGGITAAIENTSGKIPNVLFGDNSRIGRPRIYKLTEEIDKVMRSRMLNPRWIEGMMSHGYKGAFEMGASLDYLFGYDAATGLVPDWCYKEIYNKWLKNKSIKDFLTTNNPWVLRDISERLLEASNRTMWKGATKNQIEYLKDLIYESEKNIELDEY